MLGFLAEMPLSALVLLLAIIIGKHMQMLRFKCQQIRTINEEFDFWRNEGERAK